MTVARIQQHHVEVVYEGTVTVGKVYDHLIELQQDSDDNKLRVHDLFIEYLLPVPSGVRQHIIVMTGA